MLEKSLHLLYLTPHFSSTVIFTHYPVKFRTKTNSQKKMKLKRLGGGITILFFIFFERYFLRVLLVTRGCS